MAVLCLGRLLSKTSIYELPFRSVNRLGSSDAEIVCLQCREFC